MAKKERRYIESKNDALSLAESIADTQEEKVRIKKAHNIERNEALGGNKRFRSSSSDNSRLSKAKEVVRVKVAEAKKRKAEKRKDSNRSREPAKMLTPSSQKKKAVSFA